MIDIDEKLEELKSKTKGNYITQGVAFNKTCSRQMALLKLALENSASFSGLVKEMLAVRFNVDNQNTPHQPIKKPVVSKIDYDSKKRNAQNFL